MTTTNPARDWELTCHECDGSGHVYVKRQVAERQSDVQEFKEECECCEGRGFVFAFQDIPGIEEYVKACRPAPAAPGVSRVEQDERSATHGMTLGERIAHVGGRTNAQGYVEFGSPMAVDALIQHVLRDIDCTRQEDDGAYQARYRLPGGQWSSWGHVVCGVKGHEQELRYLPGERRPAPAAGDARGATERHTIEGTISFMRSDAESQVCVCCPPKTGHIFSRGVDWDAWETGAPEHFGRGPDVLVRRYATGINANEGKRVRVTVEVLPDDLAAQRKGDA